MMVVLPTRASCFQGLGCEFLKEVLAFLKGSIRALYFSWVGVPILSAGLSFNYMVVISWARDLGSRGYYRGLNT